MSPVVRPVLGPLGRALRAPVLTLLLTLMPTAAAFAGPGHSGDEGHSHDAPAARSTQSPRVVAMSEAFQLVGILKAGQLTIYLDRERSNAPVNGAAIDVTANEKTLAAQAQADGVYVVSADGLIQAGENVLEFSIKDGELTDLLGGTLAVATAQANHAPHGVAAIASWLGRSVPVGWALVAGLLTLLVGVLIGGLFSRRAVAPMALAAAFGIGVASIGPAAAGPGHSGDEGHAHGPEASEGATDSPRRLPDGSIFLPKPTQRLIEVRTEYVAPQTVRRAIRLPGRVVANPHRIAVVQSVVDGRLAPFNGRFAHIGQHVNAGDVLGYVKPVMPEIDRSDFEQTAGQLDQEIALAANRVEQFKRFTTFPAERIRTAEIELDNLVRRRATLSERKSVNEALTAPIDGVIIAAQAAIGQIVTPRDVVFQLVEPRILWVEALAHESIDVASLGSAQAVAQDADPARLKFVASSPALAQHATSIKFELTTNPSNFSIGRQVTVMAEVGKELSGIVVPRSAVVQAPNGQYVVFRHVEPERFEPKPVRFVEVDGTRVILTAGVEAGEKIAVQSATLINQIR
jgi:cobalt-zinc-cadmium efflux system membrane fusion protein